jgi:hypothetical protein
MWWQLFEMGIDVDLEGENADAFDKYIAQVKTKVLDYLNWRSGVQQESRAARQYRERWNELHANEIKKDPMVKRWPDTRRDVIPDELVPFVIDMACSDFIASWYCVPDNLKPRFIDNRYVASVTNGSTTYSFGLNPAMENIPGLTSLVDAWGEFPYEALAPYRKLHRELEYMLYADPDGPPKKVFAKTKPRRRPSVEAARNPIQPVT